MKLVVLYGIGFIISLLHLLHFQGRYRDMADIILRSFMWPPILVYFVFQFLGYVLLSAGYGLWDLITVSRSNKNVYTTNTLEPCPDCPWFESCQQYGCYIEAINKDVKLIENR